MVSPKELEQKLIEFGVLDPERVHHEFSQGLHGQKVDFDKIDEEDPIFDEWAEATAGFIEREYPLQPDALIGVAKGTNRLAKAVARKVGEGILFLATEKNDQAKPILTEEARLQVEEFKPVFALVTEDVGTVGTNSLAAAQSALAAGIPRVEVLNTWQRSSTLTLLEEAGVEYRSIIRHILPSYTPEECRGEGGLCGAGWELIPYGRK